MLKRALRGAALAVVLGASAISAPAFAAETIKVGILHSLSGTMAISETALKDVTLMAIAELNASGGVLGKQLEPVVVDPASNWPLFAEKARELLARENVAAVFGCWTSVSRKSVLPVFEELNGLLFYPVQYEGEEISRNVFYTGTVPTQEAVPAAEYLLSAAGGGARRFVLLGTDYVYPRVTNRILRAFLHEKGIRDEAIYEKYTPFGHTDYQKIVAEMKAFASQGRTAVISELNGDSNNPFYQQLAKQGLTEARVPVVSLSVGEHELREMNRKPFVGRLTVQNYFMSLKNPANDAWKQRWAAYKKAKNLPEPALPTNDPMEAAWIGVHLWKQAVEQAQTTSVDAVIAALSGQKFTAPDGLTVEMDAKNHHLHKPLFIAAAKPDGQFNVVWKSDGLLKPEPWSPFLPNNNLKPDEPAARH